MIIDDFMPEYHFNEVHKLATRATPEASFKALKELTSADLSPLIFWMLNLRSLPARLKGSHTPGAATHSKPFLEELYEGGFIPLGEQAGQEVVFGLIGQFWKLVPTPGPQIESPQAFLAYDDQAFAKVVANLAVIEQDGKTICLTETRIYVPEAETRRKFRAYWLLISLGSGWIRMLWLRGIRRKAEGES